MKQKTSLNRWWAARLRQKKFLHRQWLDGGMWLRLKINTRKVAATFFVLRQEQQYKEMAACCADIVSNCRNGFQRPLHNENRTRLSRLRLAEKKIQPFLHQPLSLSNVDIPHPASSAPLIIPSSSSDTISPPGHFSLVWLQVLGVRAGGLHAPERRPLPLVLPPRRDGPEARRCGEEGRPSPAGRAPGPQGGEQAQQAVREGRKEGRKEGRPSFYFWLGVCARRTAVSTRSLSFGLVGGGKQWHARR